MSALQDFREKFPQYHYLDDEALGEGLRRKYYSGMDVDDYRDRIGLPPRPKPAKPPTTSDRVDRKLAEKSQQTDPLAAQEPRDILADFAPGASDSPLLGNDFAYNSVKLAGQMGTHLLGSAIKGIVGAPGEALRQRAEDVAGTSKLMTGLAGKIVFGTDWGEGDPADGKFRVRYMLPQELEQHQVSDVLTEDVPEYFQSIEFAEHLSSPAQIKEQYAAGDITGTMAEVFKYGMETGIESVPAMVLMMSGPAGWATFVGGLSSQMGDERGRNKGKETGDFIDQLEALPFAMGSALMERLGAKGIVDATMASKFGKEMLESGFTAAAKRIGKNASTAMLKESGTEAFQEGVLEYLGEKLGTDAPMSWAEAIERGFFAGLAGGVFGGVAGGAGSASQELATQSELTTIKEMEDRSAAKDTTTPTVQEPGPEAPPPPREEPEEPTEPETDVPRETRTGDPRMGRDEFKLRLAQMSDELEVNSGGEPIYENPEDQSGAIIGRLPSRNPPWFQALGGTDAEMSVKGVRNAVQQALDGKPLGVRQERVVGAMLDEISGKRAEGVDYAREQLEEARKTRSLAREQAAAALDIPIMPDPLENEAGEQFEEGDYDADMTASARIIAELADAGERNGLEADVERILEKAASDQEAMAELQGLIHEHNIDQTSIELAATEQEGRAPTEAPQADLLGDDTRTAQEIADEERRRDEARQRGQESVETGDPGDLFSQARDQVDIEDVTPDGMAAPAVGTVDQRNEEQYTDPLVDMPNAAAYATDAPKAKAYGVVDVASVMATNRLFGTTAGDALIKASARALQLTDLSIYYMGDGKFRVLGKSPERISDQLNEVQNDLAKQILETSAGKLPGLKFQAGVGASLGEAVANLNGRKANALEAGEAQPKGVPPDATILESNRPDQAAGSSFVASIGKHGDLPVNADHGYQLGNGDTVIIPDKPVRREMVIKLMERLFPLKIRQGRTFGGGRKFTGLYYGGIGTIRIKYHNDLEVTAHEFGHWIDDHLPWIPNLYKQFDAELKGISYDVQKISEGWAEFMRLWMTQDYQARMASPGFYDAWMTALTERPELQADLEQIQQMMHAWYLQGALSRLSGKKGKADLSIRQRIDEFMHQLGDKILMKGFDYLRPFKQAERAIRGSVGDAIVSPYKKLRLAHGAHGIMQAIMHRGTVSWDENGDLVFSGEGLSQVFRDVEDDMDNMQLYMFARRANELLKQGRENHARPDEIAAGLALGAPDPATGAQSKYATTFEKWLKFNTRMMDFYEQSGIISAATRQTIEEHNKNYVPFNRVMDVLGGQKVKRGGGSPFMRLHGGTSNINDIFESIVGNTAHMVHLSLVNDGKRAFYRMIEETMAKRGTTDTDQAAALWASPIPTVVQRTQVQKDQVLNAMLKSADITMMEWRLMENGMFPEVNFDEAVAQHSMIKHMIDGMDELVGFWQFGQAPKGNDVDYFLDDGEAKYYEIGDRMLYDAINMLGPQPYNLAVNILGGFANVLRKGVTLTPTFQVKNFIRDTMNAFTLSRGHIVPVVGATKELAKRWYDDEHYWEYMLNGGGFAAMAQADGINSERVLDNPDKLGYFYDQVMGTFEVANRTAEYVALRNKGYTKREATFLGREISTDFAMRGSSKVLRVITISIPFMNARMQGLYRNAREVAEAPPGRKGAIIAGQAFSYALRSMLSITLPSLALLAYNYDDPRYKDLPDWIKDLSWVIFYGSGEDDYVMIPKPFETGMIWATMPERMVEYMRTKDGDELADAFMWMIQQTFALDLMPQFYQPIDDLRKNESFTGAPIVPEYLQAVSPPEQYRFYTSDAMIALSRMIDAGPDSPDWVRAVGSPLKAEYLVRGYFGTLGAWALGVADWIVGDMNQGGTEPANTWRENFLLSPFVNQGPLRRTHSQDHIYDMVKQSREVVATINMIEQRSPGRLAEQLDDAKRRVLMEANDSLQMATKDMREIGKTMEMVNYSEDIDPDEKRRQLDALQREKNKIAAQVYAVINPQSLNKMIAEAQKEADALKKLTQKEQGNAR